jgi:diguanylate cyclase (GGDEF)-like protein
MSIEATTSNPRQTGGIRFIPDDMRQALRMRRMLIGAATSLLMPLVLLVSAVLGLAEYGVVVWSAALTFAAAAVFYGLFRSGLNLRFHDQSLTGEMILAAIVSVAATSYWAGQARPAIEMFYLMALLFGALRLGAARLLWLALIALIAHATMLKVWHMNHPGGDATASLMDLAALAIILPWFAAMGAYVNGLRTRLSDSNRRLTEAVARIESIAVRDELTGMYNRRFLMEFLDRETARVRRSSGSYAICMLDIDNFKSINDSFGHAAGDAVLKHFAAVAGTCARGVDVFGRLGGEEFLLVLPDTDVRGAAACAERMRRTVAESAWPLLPPGHRVTVTAGVALYGRQEMPSALLARADSALYSGKASGRNRVVAVG